MWFNVSKEHFLLGYNPPTILWLLFPYDSLNIASFHVALYISPHFIIYVGVYPFLISFYIWNYAVFIFKLE